MRYLHSTEALCLLCYSLVHKMKINDTAFNGSTSYLTTAKHLQTVAGKNISWFSEFTPKFFHFREPLYLLMLAFLRGGNCFFLSCTFVSHVAGILDGYRGACLYIALTDTYLVRLLFQRIDSPTFQCSGFVFQLQHSVLQDDLFVYKITKDTFHEDLCFWYWCLDTLWTPLECRFHIFRLEKFRTHIF